MEQTDDGAEADVPPAVPDLSPKRPVAPAEEPSAPVVPELDAAAIGAVRPLVDADRRLGKLAEVVAWVAGTQAAVPPHPFAAPVLLTADGTADPVDDGLPRRTPGTSYDEGVAAVDAAVDEGADLLLVGGGSSLAAATVVSVVTGREPVACVRRDQPDWTAAAATVRDARRAAKPVAGDPLALLAAVDSPQLAGLVGVLVQAALRRTPVLLDGLDAVAAGLVAESYAPGCSLWWTLASASDEPAEAFAAAALELEPLLSLGLAYGGGVAARLALPILQAVLADQATSNSLPSGSSSATP